MFAASKTATPSGVAPDAQFNNVTLLLHGDGTNGAQNNTFLDSSTNNFTITRNGNTTQGSFSPFGSNWSNYFDGTADFLSTPANSGLAFGSNDFTIETWIYFTSINSSTLQIVFMSGSLGGDNMYCHVDADQISVGTSAAFISNQASSFTTNTWYHIAFCRSGGTLRLFKDGVQQGSSVTDSTSWISSGTAGIGANQSNGQTVFGYISNFRVLNGTGLYTSNFTPSTTPLTAITNTTLLTCQSNRFVDNSTSNLTLKTASGNPSVQHFNPFGTSTAYSTAVIGGSGYFNVNNSTYLTVPASSSWEFTGDYTVEAWVYLFNLNNGTIYGTGGSGAADQFTYTSVGEIYFANQGTGTGVITANNWIHVAASRNGSTQKIFVNGVAQSTAAVSGTIGQNLTAYIGRRVDATNYVSGYISDLRIVNGTAVYTSNFTPPTSPLTAISGTVLLTKMTNGAIFDNAMMNDLETVGNAQISTSVKKYGTGSMYFDGNGDYLSGITTPNLNMGTGNFTVECWVYISSRTLNYPLIFGNNNAGYNAGAIALVDSNADSGSFNDRFCLSVFDTGSSPILVSSSTNSSNTWYHLAVVRNGTNIQMYRDGTSVASATISSSIVFDWSKLGFRIGGGNWDGAQSYFDGYIDDLRITKDYARYTSTFTPPIAAFPDTGPY